VSNLPLEYLQYIRYSLGTILHSWYVDKINFVFALNIDAKVFSVYFFVEHIAI